MHGIAVKEQYYTNVTRKKQWVYRTQHDSK